MNIYLANPLGFSGLLASGLQRLVSTLEGMGHHVHEPFSAGSALGKEIAAIQSSPGMSLAEMATRLREINGVIGKQNQEAIDRCDSVVAVLDGTDVDSGVAAEIGYAFATGKLVHGIREDFRICADNYGSAVNLQVEYFIISSGGAIHRSVEELVAGIGKSPAIGGPFCIYCGARLQPVQAVVSCTACKGACSSGSRSSNTSTVPYYCHGCGGPAHVSENSPYCPDCDGPDEKDI